MKQVTGKKNPDVQIPPLLDAGAMATLEHLSPDCHNPLILSFSWFFFLFSLRIYLYLCVCKTRVSDCPGAEVTESWGLPSIRPARPFNDFFFFLKTLFLFARHRLLPCSPSYLKLLPQPFWCRDLRHGPLLSVRLSADTFTRV